MKKVIIGLSGLVILAFVVILFVNAQNNSQEVKKAATEVSASCAKCPSASACTKAGETKTASCDPAKCKINCADKKCEMKSSDKANCQSVCPMKSTAKTR